MSKIFRVRTQGEGKRTRSSVNETLKTEKGHTDHGGFWFDGRKVRRAAPRWFTCVEPFDRVAVRKGLPLPLVGSLKLTWS